MPIIPIEWLDGRIRILDQTLLPEETVYREIDTVEALAEAIRRLQVRGAPAIGVAAAMGIALAACRSGESRPSGFRVQLRTAMSLLASTRPTAVNLFRALGRMEQVLETTIKESVPSIRDRVVQEALAVRDEDRSVCRTIGRNGAVLLPDPASVLTHCNAGALATAGYGTALGAVYAAVESGKKIRVYADETRPLLQGARLTAWELQQAGIDVTVVCDSAAGFLMQKKKVDCVLVGADRIAANGDTANKIGTYGLAVLAKHHGIPFYVAAPASTFDSMIRSGSEIPIEERLPEEVSLGFGKRTVPEGVSVLNPAFDVTPYSLITAFVTEKGVVYPPFEPALTRMFPGKTPDRRIFQLE